MDLRFFLLFVVMCVCTYQFLTRDMNTKKKNEMLLISSFTSITHIILSFERVVHVVIVSRQVARKLALLGVVVRTCEYAV